MSHVPLRTLAGATLVAAITSTASAGVVPALEVDLSVSDGSSTTFNPSGSSLPGGLFNYVGDQTTVNYMVSWNLLASPDLTNPDGAFVTNGFTIENLSDQTLEFDLTVTLPVDQAAAFVDYAGSVGLGLTGTDATVATLDGSSLWSGLVDGVALQTAFDDPYSLGFSGDGSANDSFNFSGDDGGVMSSIGINLSFSLTPGDTLITTGAFGIVPAPAGLGLLAVAGLGGRRRRRA